jgi:hypothetical protein
MSARVSEGGRSDTGSGGRVASMLNSHGSNQTEWRWTPHRVSSHDFGYGSRRHVARRTPHAVLTTEVLGVLVVHKRREVTSVVEDEVEGLAVGEGGEGLLDAPEVLLLGLALPGVDGDTGRGDGGGGVVLGGEDVARGPGDLGAERGEGLDEDGGLDGPVASALAGAGAMGGRESTRQGRTTGQEEGRRHGRRDDWHG